MFGVDFVYLFSSLVFLDYVSPFNICGKADMMVLNSLNLGLSEKLFISPSILNEILVGYSNLGCRFSPFSTLYPAIPFWPAELWLKDQLLSLWGFPCMLLVASPLLLLIFFFCLVFLSLISMCRGVFLLGFILYGTLGLD